MGNILEELTGRNQIGFNIALNRANEDELSNAKGILFSKIEKLTQNLRNCQSTKQSNVYLMIINQMDYRMKLISNRLLKILNN